MGFGQEEREGFIVKLKEIFITKKPAERLHQITSPVIGLTGGIATGKSTVSNYLQEKGLPVICADKLVKEVYRDKETLNFISSEFPNVLSDNQIDFKKLRESAFSSTENREKLESFIYKKLPLVFKSKLSEFNNPQFVIYDIPLLFEKEMEDLFDVTICVYCSKEEQVKRIIKRDQSSEEMALKILENQLPIDQKKELSDFKIKNSGTIEKLELEIEALLSILLEE